MIELHPNLARIAVSYQDIAKSYANGSIDAATATVRARELVARDDTGVMWTINPRDGGWLRCLHNGTWVPGEPPREGFANLTPWQLYGTGGPDHSLSYTAAKDSSGATWQIARNRELVSNANRPRWVYPVLLVVAAATMAFAALASADNGEAATGVTIPEAITSP